MPQGATQERQDTVKGSDKIGPLEEEMVSPPSILAMRTHEQYSKAKRYDTR